MKNKWLLPVVRGVVPQWCLNISGSTVRSKQILVKATVSSWWYICMGTFLTLLSRTTAAAQMPQSHKYRRTQMFSCLSVKALRLAVRVFSGVIGCFSSL